MMTWSHMWTFLEFVCWFWFTFCFVCVFVSFCVGLVQFVPVFLAFVVLGLAYSVSSQEMGSEERVQNDLFSVKWDIKSWLRESINQSIGVQFTVFSVSRCLRKCILHILLSHFLYFVISCMHWHGSFISILTVFPCYFFCSHCCSALRWPLACYKTVCCIFYCYLYL